MGLAALNALRLVELAGRPDVPVYLGAAEPLVQRPAPGYAAVELARRVLGAPGEIAVLALGPLTNIALAMRLEPRFATAVKEII